MRQMFARVLALLALAFGFVQCAEAASPAARKPNIIFILADDLGYGDVRCYNPDRGKIATPHVDRLAREGMRFTDAHASSAVCSPSRYTLLTGRYNWRTRLQSGIVNEFGPPPIGLEKTSRQAARSPAVAVAPPPPAFAPTRDAGIWPLPIAQSQPRRHLPNPAAR